MQLHGSSTQLCRISMNNIHKRPRMWRTSGLSAVMGVVNGRKKITRIMLVRMENLHQRQL
ncbi:hypothetical protein DUNSADRAFT_1178 [Dunaliella salina]|uniref:Encoded protein n=1 Tax=Dunaliella salina TaxID=3046 RepID=A0ABQ7FXW7_DUNSA|nr:hypothetical protein DUNSADRAFT_1178 [Dunaliella salina]|eukprot:KAF5827186.1 hypothetical protein DUNSADRAFT_1178 [Dunaliella salina]